MSNFNTITHTKLLFFAFYFLIIIGMPVLSYSQQDSIKNLGEQEITVVKDYIPTLNDANKISDLPAADTSSFQSPELKYDIEPKKFNTAYTVTPIKPVKIKDENIKKLYHGFAKAGYGTHNSPMAEIFFNALRSKEFDAGFHFNHLSSTGRIKNYGYSNNSRTGLELFGKKYIDAGTLAASLGVTSNMVHYYGYNHDETIYSKQETKQVFSGINSNISYSNNNTDKQLWNFDAGIKFSGFHGKRQNDESREGNFIASAGLGKYFFDNYGSLHAELDYSSLSQPLISDINNTIFKIEPRYKLKVSDFDLTTGLNFAYESATVSKTHLYPHAAISYIIGKDVMKIFAELTGRLNKHTYKSIAQENPFTGNIIGVANSNHKFDLRAGMDIRLDKEISFNGYAAYQQIADDAYFFNNPQFSNEPVTYSVVYDNADVVTIHGELQFHKNDKAQFAAKADYFSYKTDSIAKPWYKPSAVFTLSGNYVMADKIILKTDWNYRGSVFYPDYKDGASSSTLKGWFDASLGIEYRYTKVLSVFLNLNNIGGVNYERWYNYPVYGFNVLGGLTYSF